MGISMETLIGKKVAIIDPYLLQFFYPRFTVVSDLSQPIDYSKGVIYTGQLLGSVQQKLTWITRGLFIIVSPYGDIKLETPQDYIKVFMPKFDNISDKISRW